MRVFFSKGREEVVACVCCVRVLSMMDVAVIIYLEEKGVGPSSGMIHNKELGGRARAHTHAESNDETKLLAINSKVKRPSLVGSILFRD